METATMPAPAPGALAARRGGGCHSAHDLNPHSFLNPPAYSYLPHVVFELWFGGPDGVGRRFD